MPEKVAVVDEGASNGPIQADRRMTCAQSKRAGKTVQEETEQVAEGDQEQEATKEQNEDDQERKDAESEESKHGDFKKADEIGTETDSQKADK